MEKRSRIKELFDLYTSDLSFEEIEKLIKHDSPEVFQFFAKDISKKNLKHNKLIRFLIFIRNLFNAFLLKLTPARRVIYLAAIIIITTGIFFGITSYIILSFLMLNLLIAFELADKLTTTDDISLAKSIQENLIPENPPVNDHYDIATYYKSARIISGDYFDFIKCPHQKDSFYVIIGDISGKGLASALYMVRVQAILQSLINAYSEMKDILCNLNKYFSQNLSQGYFLTLLLAKIDNLGKISLSRAGHTPLVFYKSSEMQFKDYNPKGLGIGLNNGPIFESSIEEIIISPEKDDILFFYTDGVTEAMDSVKNEYGIERIKKLIGENREKSVSEISILIQQSITKFRGTAPLNDDITFIIIKKK